MNQIKLSLSKALERRAKCEHLLSWYPSEKSGPALEREIDGFPVFIMLCERCIEKTVIEQKEIKVSFRVDWEGKVKLK